MPSDEEHRTVGVSHHIFGDAPENRPTQATPPVRRHAHDAIIAALHHVDDCVLGAPLIRGEDLNGQKWIAVRDLGEVLLRVERPTVLSGHQQQTAPDALRERLGEGQRTFGVRGLVERNNERLRCHGSEPTGTLVGCSGSPAPARRDEGT